MKRFLLLSALAITTLSVSAQERSVRMSPRGFSKSLEQATSAPAFKGLKPNSNTMRSGSRATVCAAVIGTSTNAYGTLRPNTHNLSVNQDLNTVVFVYRNDINEFPDNTSSQYRYAISTDKGDLFFNNIGPLNPAADGAVGGINARYPQGVIYNPSGNTDAQNAWMTYTGAWHNGATGNETWEGLTNGVVRLNNDLGTSTEHNDLMNDGDVTIPSSLVQGKHGEFWTIDQEYTGQVNDSLLIVYKGVWTGTDVSWSIFAKLNPGWVPVNDTTTSFNEAISFSPDGKHGWIAGVAHFTQNLSPYLYYSSDSGATWTGPMVVDFSDPSLANLDADLISPDVTPNPPPTVAELDLVVDKNGDPHLAVMLTPGAELSTNFYPGLLKIYDLTYSITGFTWTATFVDTTSAYDGVIGVSSTGDYSQSNRLQSSITPHGEWVSMIWADTDPLSGTDNSLPDLKGVAINIEEDTMTQVINFTSTDLDWAGVATQHSISPVSFYDATTHKINVPTVVTRINQNTGNADDAVTYFYIRNINFNDDNSACNITIGINDVASVEELTLSPNPSSDMITLQGMEFNNSVISVVNVLGEVLSTEIVSASTYQINVAALPAGFYSVLVSDNGSTITKKFVVQH